MSNYFKKETSKFMVILFVVLFISILTTIIIKTNLFSLSKKTNTTSSLETSILTTELTSNSTTSQVTTTTEHSTTITSTTTLAVTTTKISTTSTRQTVSSNQQIIDVPTTAELRKIVNKKHALPANYNPGEHPIAKKAFLKLKSDMQQLGFAISDKYSGFRSYAYQKKLYERYVAADGKANAERYSARPGHSEHQLGLAFDFIDTTEHLLGDGIQDGASEWLAKNAHLYGFVVRYLKGKEHITGYMAETWHVRFIGNDAIDVYHSGLTLEEFYGVPGGGYND